MEKYSAESFDGARLLIFFDMTPERGAKILRVFGENPALVLPREVDGHVVTDIAPYCFARERRISLEMDDVPEGLSELCGANISSVTLPDGVTVIGNLAFYNCNKMTDISIGTNVSSVGSDVFMNCSGFHDITVRGSVKQPAGIRQILSQISSDMLVTYISGGRIEAAVFFPDYYESLDEIAPAHIFGRNIEGEGFRARQCFADEVLNLAQYDGIFYKAMAEEKDATLYRMAISRLMYPVDLSETARETYESYLKGKASEICHLALEYRNLEELTFLINNKYAPYDVVTDCILRATKMEWSEGAAALMHMKNNIYKNSPADRYSFDEF